VDVDDLPRFAAISGRARIGTFAPNAVAERWFPNDLHYVPTTQPSKLLINAEFVQAPRCWTGPHEAYLDVTENLQDIASERERWLNRSEQKFAPRPSWQRPSGISFNKFPAKVASDQRKPDDLFVITPATRGRSPAFVGEGSLSKSRFADSDHHPKSIAYCNGARRSSGLMTSRIVLVSTRV